MEGKPTSDKVQVGEAFWTSSCSKNCSPKFAGIDLLHGYKIHLQCVISQENLSSELSLTCATSPHTSRGAARGGQGMHTYPTQGELHLPSTGQNALHSILSQLKIHAHFCSVQINCVSSQIQDSVSTGHVSCPSRISVTLELKSITFSCSFLWCPPFPHMGPNKNQLSKTFHWVWKQS